MLKEPSVSECDELIWISGSCVVLSVFFLHQIATSCRNLDNGFGVDVAMTEMFMSGIRLGKDIESCSSDLFQLWHHSYLFLSVLMWIEVNSYFAHL